MHVATFVFGLIINHSEFQIQKTLFHLTQTLTINALELNTYPSHPKWVFIELNHLGGNKTKLEPIQLDSGKQILSLPKAELSPGTYELVIKGKETIGLKKSPRLHHIKQNLDFRYRVTKLNYWVLAGKEEQLLVMNPQNLELFISPFQKHNWIPYGKGVSSAIDTLWIENRVIMLKQDGRIMLRTAPESEWQDISCPIRLPDETGKPFALATLKNQLFWGAYNARKEGQPGKANIYLMDLDTGTWSLHKSFHARHIHALHTFGNQLWASVGDAKWGDHIGIWKLGNQDWIQVTSPKPPFTDHYPVDFFVDESNIWMASDRPNRFILKAKRKEAQQNIKTALCSPRNRPPGETVRNLVRFPSQNMLFFTAETTRPQIWVSAPPYLDGESVFDFDQPLVALRPIVFGSHCYVREYEIIEEKLENPSSH